MHCRKLSMKTFEENRKSIDLDIKSLGIEIWELLIDALAGKKVRDSGAGTAGLSVFLF